jgi:hypothetical protein
MKILCSRMPRLATFSQVRRNLSNLPEVLKRLLFQRPIFADNHSSFRIPKTQDRKLNCERHWYAAWVHIQYSLSLSSQSIPGFAHSIPSWMICVVWLTKGVLCRFECVVALFMTHFQNWFAHVNWEFSEWFAPWCEISWNQYSWFCRINASRIFDWSILPSDNQLLNNCTSHKLSCRLI